MNYLSTLNEKQLEAVTTTEGYLRVIAGAGSGKTKLLVSRYAYLVKEYGIDSSNILCVTFTNKAAGEMRRRIRSLIGEEYDTSLICTYHGFCVRVLREDVEKIFYPKEFQIIDGSQQKAMLGDIYQKFELKLDHASFEKVMKQIGEFKSSNQDYVQKMCDTKQCQIMPDIRSLDDRIVEEFLQRQKQVYATDFQDLIYFTLDIFNRCPEVLAKCADIKSSAMFTICNIRIIRVWMWDASVPDGWKGIRKERKDGSRSLKTSRREKRTLKTVSGKPQRIPTVILKSRTI
ncbi:MAG: UvrD-helicase domain-containing protein [Lachnospiraceae bacterium]|nr:UvrD-helicase domain-containing protein [Lachnospiraceae bacterium]